MPPQEQIQTEILGFELITSIPHAPPFWFALWMDGKQGVCFSACSYTRIVCYHSLEFSSELYHCLQSTSLRFFSSRFFLADFLEGAFAICYLFKFVYVLRSIMLRFISILELINLRMKPMVFYNTTK